MVTAAHEEATLILPWDEFLNRNDASASVRMHVSTFRQAEWPNIKRQLAAGFFIEVPEELEPHWVAPGKAVYWSHQVDRYLQQDMDRGWIPTNGLPAGNAQNIAHYLKKGFRLRPPSEGVQDVVFHESAAQQEEAIAVQREAKKARVFECDRHPEKGVLEFANWRAYIQHCTHYREAPDKQPPPEVLDQAAKHEYYCYLHGKGFDNKAHAVRHLRNEVRKGMRNHPTLEEMVMPKKE